MSTVAEAVVNLVAGICWSSSLFDLGKLRLFVSLPATYHLHHLRSFTTQSTSHAFMNHQVI